MLNFSEIIYNWDLMTPKEKFIAVAKYQKQKAKPKIIRKPQVNRIRKPKVKKYKPLFSIQEGYYKSKDLILLANISYATLKRYISKGSIREQRQGRNVVYCLYDVIIEKENALNIRRQNGKVTGNKNKKL